MVLAMPFYLGLAATAEPLVLTMLGAKWAEAIPVVRLLALAMPFMTLLVLYAPACDACGRPGIGVGNGAAGAAILAAGFLIGVRWGPVGLASAWIVAYPAYLAIASWRALPVIGARAADVARAIAPSALAAIATAGAVLALARTLPPLPQVAHLAILVSVGAGVYAGWLLVFARATLVQLRDTVRAR